jgi:hypothetical protein
MAPDLPLESAGPAPGGDGSPPHQEGDGDHGDPRANGHGGHGRQVARRARPFGRGGGRVGRGDGHGVRGAHGGGGPAGHDGGLPRRIGIEGRGHGRRGQRDAPYNSHDEYDVVMQMPRLGIVVADMGGRLIIRSLRDGDQDEDRNEQVFLYGGLEPALICTTCGLHPAGGWLGMVEHAVEAHYQQQQQ